MAGKQGWDGRQAGPGWQASRAGMAGMHDRLRLLIPVLLVDPGSTTGLLVSPSWICSAIVSHSDAGFRGSGGSVTMRHLVCGPQRPCLYVPTPLCASATKRSGAARRACGTHICRQGRYAYSLWAARCSFSPLPTCGAIASVHRVGVPSPSTRKRPSMNDEGGGVRVMTPVGPQLRVVRAESREGSPSPNATRGVWHTHTHAPTPHGAQLAYCK